MGLGPWICVKHDASGMTGECLACKSPGLTFETAADRENLETMRDLLSQARIRLDQYIGMCRCPGESCVSACRECDATQELTGRIRAFMQGRTAR